MLLTLAIGLAYRAWIKRQSEPQDAYVMIDGRLTSLFEAAAAAARSPARA